VRRAAHILEHAQSDLRVTDANAIDLLQVRRTSGDKFSQEKTTWFLCASVPLW